MHIYLFYTVYYLQSSAQMSLVSLERHAELDYKGKKFIAINTLATILIVKKKKKGNIH